MIYLFVGSLLHDVYARSSLYTRLIHSRSSNTINRPARRRRRRINNVKIDLARVTDIIIIYYVYNK